MPKFLIEANYSDTGAKGLIQDGGTTRRKAVEQLLSSVGGKLESFYYAFGETDCYAIFDAPDNASAASAALTVAASGAVKIKTVVLISVEELDTAVKKSPSYDKPGPG